MEEMVDVWHSQSNIREITLFPDVKEEGEGLNKEIERKEKSIKQLRSSLQIAPNDKLNPYLAEMVQTHRMKLKLRLQKYRENRLSGNQG